MQITVENITPKKAERILNKFNDNNRKLRDGVAERYADDMREGKWTTCTAPIAFYTDGMLADGQHRLFAVVLSGKPQRFVIMRDLQREDGLNIDVGVPRTLVDASRISGTDMHLSNTIVACARAIAEGDTSRNNLSNARRLTYINTHREAAEWAAKHGPRAKRIRNAPMLAAIARAYYIEDNKERLQQFAAVVNNGFAQGPEDSAAVAIRNYLINKGGQAANTQSWRDTFLKIQNAIHYFMKRKPLTVIKGVQDEAYPLKGKK